MYVSLFCNLHVPRKPFSLNDKGDTSKRKNPYDQPEEPTNKRSRGLFAQQELDSSHSGYTTNRPSSAGNPNIVTKVSIHFRI